MNLTSLKLTLICLYLFLIPNKLIGNEYPVYNEISAIAVVDQDTLFTQSYGGKKILEKVETMVSQLASENRKIEKSLEVEELLLTEKRKTISSLEFNVFALEFDSRVKKIRDQQAKKQIDINSYLNKSRSKFFERITPILLNFIDELGVVILLNKDTVALASVGSDITQLAITRINVLLKD